MNTYVKFLGGGALAVGVVAATGWGWVEWSVSDRLGQAYETHRVELPVPFPLSEQEIAALEAERAQTLADAAGAQAGDALDGGDAPTVEPLTEEELRQIALDRAIERGDHLVHARYVCVECHGADFGGGTMVDDPAIGTLLGPNLTTGAGSVTTDYTMADWDRIVRHGVKPDGTATVMPSEDFLRMSDRELSDIVAYIRDQPPVDATVPRLAFGPLGKVLIATGQIPLTAENIADHSAAHPVEPPDPAPTPAFGRHLAGVCTGCHGKDFAGGTIPGGDPSWAPAANITPHEDALADWTFEEFDRAMRTGVLPDGSEAAVPMSQIIPYTANMTDTEMKALWAYIQSIEPVAGTPGGG